MASKLSAKPELICFANRDAMASRIGELVATYLGKAIGEQGKASLMASGGSTPAGLYQDLSQRKLDWNKVKIGLVDERWIAPGLAGSNEDFVRQTLLINRAARSEFTGLWADEPSPRAGLSIVERRVEKFVHLDVVILGMGNDGHTASWFPHADGLDDALAQDGAKLAVIRARPSKVTGDHLDRMTLSLSAVRKAGLIVLLMNGQEKRTIWQQACTDGPVVDMPVRAVIKSRPDMWVCWAP